MSSIQDYSDDGENWDRPCAVSTNTPRHTPRASRRAPHASHSGPQRRRPVRSPREAEPAPPTQTSRGTPHPRRSSQTGIQNAAPRPPRDRVSASRIDREEGEDPPPPPYEPLPPQPAFAGSRNASDVDLSALGEMAAELEIDDPRPISSVQDIRDDDAVIAVMGMTGSGKTTFISHFCATARAGHGLRSATAEVEAHLATRPIRDRRVIFVDTPGFDDTARSDTEVLRDIVNWLNVTYAQNIKITGIVYLHGINLPRVTGSAHINMRLFRELCGDESMSSVVLATTHWSRSASERASQELRHEQLVTDDAFWRRMERNGARVFKDDRGETSARAIVHYLLDRGREGGSGGGMNLRVQREMAEGRTLDQTAVGIVLERRMEEMRVVYERQLGDLKSDLDEARRQMVQNQQRIEEINEDRLRLEERLDEERAYRRQLRRNLHELQRERSEERRERREQRERWERLERRRRRERRERNPKGDCIVM